MSCSDHLLSLAAPLFDPHPPIKAARCDRFLSLGHRHHFLILPPQRLSSPRPPRPLRHLSAPRGPLGRFPLRKRLLSPHKRTLQHHRPRLKKHPLIPREASAFGAIPSRHIPPHPPISSPQRAPLKHDSHIDERVPGYLPRSCARRQCDLQILLITFPATLRSRYPICRSSPTRTSHLTHTETPTLC
ncbi:hypothetical protein BO79DRAFT_266094 [Aspergillus costaricaensis CBS 115574]|uniref:Uncharacterized protein n=1 Tax=Aspergillus costaricaensis CBS 115574 TaxID=1448317 RepID=A0ACD1IFY5_9EURO|nr:hypothetical protein BO79DRAFT_266094 [Aspergillus costaricaensis CBS 115574]RAK88691.1 hypothetical protein BO79DRAFT_266094 [Aspergillus costaricaensis CBS 115574]